MDASPTIAQTQGELRDQPATISFVADRLYAIPPPELVVVTLFHQVCCTGWRSACLRTLPEHTFLPGRLLAHVDMPPCRELQDARRCSRDNEKENMIYLLHLQVYGVHHDMCIPEKLARKEIRGSTCDREKGMVPTSVLVTCDDRKRRQGALTLFDLVFEASKQQATTHRSVEIALSCTAVPSVQRMHSLHGAAVASRKLNAAAVRGGSCRSHFRRP